MSKLLKFIVILVVALIFISNCSYVFAAVDMNLANNTSSSTTGNTSTTTSSAVTTSDFDLELTNILCICLIAVGVLLIFLGIAILIRLKG